MEWPRQQQLNPNAAEFVPSSGSRSSDSAGSWPSPSKNNNVISSSAGPLSETVATSFPDANVMSRQTRRVTSDAIEEDSAELIFYGRPSRMMEEFNKEVLDIPNPESLAMPRRVSPDSAFGSSQGSSPKGTDDVQDSKFSSFADKTSK